MVQSVAEQHVRGECDLAAASASEHVGEAADEGAEVVRDEQLAVGAECVGVSVERVRRGVAEDEGVPFKVAHELQGVYCDQIYD